MRSVLIAFAVIIIFAFARYVIAEADKAQHRVDVIHQALDDLSDCRTEAYNKRAYDSIRTHLAPPDNDFHATKEQLNDSSLPSEADRKLLADYRTDVTACKAKALEETRSVAPEMVSRISERIAQANDVMQRLIDGKISWGEAAHLGEQMTQN